MHADLTAARPGALEWLAETYQKTANDRTKGDTPPMPDLLTPGECPDIESLNLPPRALEFLRDGTHGGDRSGRLIETACALFKARLNEQQVLSVLMHNEHAAEVALDHRRQDWDRAAEYTWEHHVLKAKAKASVLGLDDFVIEDELEGTHSVQEPLPASTAREIEKKARIRVESADTFMVGGKPLAFFVDRVMTEAELGALFSPSGAGKTMVAVDMLASVALARPWRGRRVRQAPVVYGCLEGESGMRLRLRAYCKKYGVSLGRAFEVLTGPVDIHKAGGEEVLIEILRRRGPRGIFVLDTLARATPGADEVGSRDMGPVIARCRDIHRATGWTVLLIAHAGKDEGRGIRGWSGIKGALDFELEVTRRGTARYLTVTKMKDGQGEGDVYAFEIESVEVGVDEDGMPITAGVAVESSAPPPSSAAARVKGANQLVVLRALDDLASAGNTRPTTRQVIEAAAALLPPGTGTRANTQNQRAQSALTALTGLGVVRTEGEHCFRDPGPVADLGADE